MTERQIDPTEYPIPHPPLLEFTRANGLDPWNIPVDSPMFIKGEELTATQFVHETVDGRPRKVLIHNPDGTIDSFAKRTVTVPLISPPEDHGL